jgi:DNA-binding NarL/FixJ family response regulator
VMVRIWHEWFSARVRMAAVTLGALADSVPGLSAEQQASYLLEAERVYADGRTVLERYEDPSGHWGPEGRAWVSRLEAEWLRLRWLVGTDAPPADELVGAWRDAAACFDVFGHVHEAARARAVLAVVLRATGDAAGARVAGDEARELAHALGATPLIDQLTAAGSTASRGQGGPDTLTPREKEILALVAQGRTNGEIGRQLFISTKTVSVHVSNILGKLGASGRTEAAAIARRRGLLDT